MSQFSFLGGFIEELIAQNGLEHLTEEQRKFYIPQILALLEERLGLEMLPKLNEDQMAQFADLAESPDTTGEQWKDFWYTSIPDFEGELKAVMKDFADQTKKILAGGQA